MASRPKKILEEIHPLSIIREVEKWPALYVRDCPERANSHFRLKIWCEVAKKLFPEWETYTKIEKDKKVSDLTRKWRNLRDTFKRQVQLERRAREGQPVRRKVYVYYPHMAFMRAHIAGDSDDDAPAAPAPAPAPADPGPARRAKRRRADLPAARPAPPASTTVYLEEIDEDKHFLMSLVPSFKKMTEDEKLTVKVEILRAIKSVRSSSFGCQAADSLEYRAELVEVPDGPEAIKQEMFAEGELDQHSNTDNDSN